MTPIRYELNAGSTYVRGEKVSLIKQFPLMSMQHAF